MELSHTHYGPRTGFPFGSPEHPPPPPPPPLCKLNGLSLTNVPGECRTVVIAKGFVATTTGKYIKCMRRKIHHMVPSLVKHWSSSSSSSVEQPPSSDWLFCHFGCAHVKKKTTKFVCGIFTVRLKTALPAYWRRQTLKASRLGAPTLASFRAFQSLVVLG
jgi:hypothetical protein